MKRVHLLLLVLLALAVWPAAASASHGPAGAGNDATAGGGQAFVFGFGNVGFNVAAHATEEGVLGGARGRVVIRGDATDLNLEVVCMTNVGNFSFIETRDPETGLFYDVSVIDSGLPGGEGDHFAFSGPWADPICGGGIAAENSFVTSGNVVVHDDDVP